MHFKIVTAVLLLVISQNSCNGLRCTHDGGGLSFCQPGGNITLYNPAGINEKQVVLRNDQSGHTDDACCEIIHCGNKGCEGVNNCENGNSCVDNNAFSTLTALTNYSKLSGCLARYCNPGPSASCVCTYHPSASHYSSASQINILCDGELINPSCSIKLSERPSGPKALAFTCTWEKEYFDVEATLDIPFSEAGTNRKCSTEENSVKAGLFSPSVFLKGATQTKAFCSLTMTSLPDIQKTCAFSHYISPMISSINVGESINLTCPPGAGNVTWWEITTSNIISLESNISTVAPMTGIFCAKTPNENGFIIICKDRTWRNYQVLGIGKIIVREASSEGSTAATSLCFDTQTSTRTPFSSNTSGSKKQVLNIWEITGRKAITADITSCSNTLTTPISSNTQSWISNSQEDGNIIHHSKLSTVYSTSSYSSPIMTNDTGVMLVTLGILLISLGLALILISIALFIAWRVHKKKPEKQQMSKHEYDTIILGTRGQNLTLFSNESDTPKDESTTSQNIIRTTNAELSCEDQSSFDPLEDMYHTIDESDISQKCITYRNDNITLSAESSSSTTMPPPTSSPSPCTYTEIPELYVNQTNPTFDDLHHEYFSWNDVECKENM